MLFTVAILLHTKPHIMATKKSPTKATKKKDTLTKIAEKIGEIAGEISVKKDKLTNMASHAVDSVKEGVHNLVVKEQALVKKLKGNSKKKAAEPLKANGELLKKVLHKKRATKKAGPVKKATVQKVAVPKKATGK